MDKTMRDRAIELARQGFSVFPLKAGTKDTPIIPRGTRLKKGEYYDVVPTSDVDKVRAMWTRPDGESHNYNIGGCTNNLLVFDLDNKDGKSGTDAFVPIARELGLTEITPAARTPTGGQHRFYNLPGELHDLAPRARNTVSELAPGVDTRGWPATWSCPAAVCRPASTHGCCRPTAPPWRPPPRRRWRACCSPASGARST